MRINRWLNKIVGFLNSSVNSPDTQPNKPISKRKSKAVHRSMRKAIGIFLLLMLCAGLFIAFLYIPAQVARLYGPPMPSLSLPERAQYSALLLWYDGLLTQPLDLNGTEQSFTIGMGESVDSVANRSEERRG